MTTTTQMLRKAEELEGQARTLRQAAALMNGHYTTKAAANLDKRLTKAAALRAAAPGSTALRGPDYWNAIGAALDPATAYTPKALRAAWTAAGVRIPSSAQQSMIMRKIGWKVDGRSARATWTHTGSNETAAAGKPPRKSKYPQTKARTTANRKATAKILRRLSKQKEPVAAKFFSNVRVPVAVLIRHGYVAKKGDGFERTDKPFQV